MPLHQTFIHKVINICILYEIINITIINSYKPSKINKIKHSSQKLIIRINLTNPLKKNFTLDKKGWVCKKTILFIFETLKKGCFDWTKLKNKTLTRPPLPSFAAFEKTEAQIYCPNEIPSENDLKRELERDRKMRVCACVCVRVRAFVCVCVSVNVRAYI